MNHGVLVVSLDEGKVVVSSGKKKRTFAHDDVEGIGEFIAEQDPFRITFSSSVNHPDEYGFPEDFDLNPFFAKAVEYARLKTAIRFPPLPLQEAPEALEAAMAAAPKDRPVTVVFLKSGKDGQDVAVSFEGEPEMEMFVGGLRYARNLLKIAAKG